MTNINNSPKPITGTILLCISVVLIFCTYYFDMNDWIKVISKFSFLMIGAFKIIPLINKLLKPISYYKFCKLWEAFLKGAMAFSVAVSIISYIFEDTKPIFKQLLPLIVTSILFCYTIFFSYAHKLFIGIKSYNIRLGGDIGYVIGILDEVGLALKKRETDVYYFYTGDLAIFNYQYLVKDYGDYSIIFADRKLKEELDSNNKNHLINSTTYSTIVESIK